MLDNPIVTTRYVEWDAGDFEAWQLGQMRIDVRMPVMGGLSHREPAIQRSVIEVADVWIRLLLCLQGDSLAGQLVGSIDEQGILSPSGSSRTRHSRCDWAMDNGTLRTGRQSAWNTVFSVGIGESDVGIKIRGVIEGRVHEVTIRRPAAVSVPDTCAWSSNDLRAKDLRRALERRYRSIAACSEDADWTRVSAVFEVGANGRVYNVELLNWHDPKRGEAAPVGTCLRNELRHVIVPPARGASRHPWGVTLDIRGGTGYRREDLSLHEVRAVGCRGIIRILRESVEASAGVFDGVVAATFSEAMKEFRTHGELVAGKCLQQHWALFRAVGVWPGSSWVEEQYRSFRGVGAAEVHQRMSALAALLPEESEEWEEATLVVKNIEAAERAWLAEMFDFSGVSESPRSQPPQMCERYE